MVKTLRQRLPASVRNWHQSPLTPITFAVLASIATAAAATAIVPANLKPTPPGLQADAPNKLSLQPPALNTKPSPRPRPRMHLVSGLASWYGALWQNRRTASGSLFDLNKLTAAHRDLPFGSQVRVTNLRNRRSVVVTVTDRGDLPTGRVIDLSYAAAAQLNMVDAGVDRVSLEVLPRRARIVVDE